MPKSKAKKISGERASQYYDPLWSPEKKKKITRKLPESPELQFKMEDLGPKGPIPKYFPTMLEFQRDFKSVLGPVEVGGNGKPYPWAFEAPKGEESKERCLQLRRDCEGLAEPGAVEKWQKKIKVLNKEGQVFASKEWLAKYGETTLEKLNSRPWHFPIKIV